jgi:hypothetical protein
MGRIQRNTSFLVGFWTTEHMSSLTNAFRTACSRESGGDLVCHGENAVFVAHDLFEQHVRELSMPQVRIRAGVDGCGDGSCHQRGRKSTSLLSYLDFVVESSSSVHAHYGDMRTLNSGFIGSSKAGVRGWPSIWETRVARPCIRRFLCEHFQRSMIGWRGARCDSGRAPLCFAIGPKVQL